MIATTAALCLALNAYHEARGEPLHGQVAVAQVVLRRARYDERRVCSEVYRPKQFSWTRSPRGWQDRVAWSRALDAARLALLWSKGAPIRDHSAGATHYHAAHVKPYWARGRVPVAVIGRHVFHKGIA